MLTASRWSSEPPFQGFRSEGEASIRCRIFIKEAAAPLVKGAGGLSQRCNIPAHGQSVSGDGALPYFVGSGQEQSAMPCSCQCSAWLRSGVSGWDFWAVLCAFPGLAKCRTSSQALAPVRFGAGVIGFCLRCGGVAWVNGLMVNRSEWSFFTGGKEYFLV